MQEQLSVRINSELRAWLARRAAAEVRTVGALVRSLLVAAMRADAPQPLPEQEAEAADPDPEPEPDDPDPWDGLDIPVPLQRT